MTAILKLPEDDEKVLRDGISLGNNPWPMNSDAYARHDTSNAQVINSPITMFVTILMPAYDLLY